ncbi:MAG: aldo/keto reductase [Cucumibacter sp.]
MQEPRQGALDKRRIGTTRLKVTTLGLGSGSLAGNSWPVAEADARGVFPRALDRGVNLVDTSPYYGFGKAEHFVGDALRGREGIVLSTKVGRLLVPVNGKRERKHGWQDPLPFDAVYDYSYDGVMRSYEDSLQRLGLDRIDILLVHDIGDEGHGTTGKRYWRQLKSGGYKALQKLRKSGAISAIGLGTNEWQVPMQAFELGDWDVVLLAGRYTLLEQTALSPFLETCVKRKVSVICGGPFNSGILVGGTTWNYAKAPKRVVDKVRAIEAICTEFGVPLPAAALQFPIRHQAIATVLPGPRTPAEFDQIWAWWNTPIPDRLWSALRERGLLDPKAPI